MVQDLNAVNECRGGLTIVQDGKHVQLAAVFDSESVLSEFGERPDEVIGGVHEASYSQHRQRRVKAIKRTMARSAVLVPPSQEARYQSFFTEKAILSLPRSR
jgi:hypothetical protein